MSGKNSQEIKIKKGDFVIQEGAPCDGLYMIRDGQFEVYKKGGEDKIPLSVARSGQFLGEMAVLTGDAHTASVKALTNGTLIKIPKDVIDAQIKAAPSWLVSLARGLALRLRKTNLVLKKNNIIDSSIQEAIHAIEQNQLAEDEEAEATKAT